MNLFKKALVIGGLGMSLAFSLGGIVPTTAVFAIDADEAQDIVSDMYPGVMIYGLEVVEDGSQVLFPSQRIGPSSVTINEDGEVVDEDVHYR